MVEGGPEARASFPPSRRLGEAAIEKRAGVGKSRRAVVEPVKQRCSVDPRKGGALCVEREISSAVAGGVPDAVDRLIQQTQRQRRVLRQGQDDQCAAYAFAPGLDNLQPGGEREREALGHTQLVERQALEPV